MAARPRARPSPSPRSLAPLLLCLLVLLPGARAQLGDGVDVGTEDADADADGEGASVEVASYFTEFTREGPYPYQVCEDLPGEIAVSGATSDVARTARCIPVEQGELEFCSAVSYETCSRVVSPTLYDETTKSAHDERVARYTLEFPALATTECTDAFALYACLAGFPRCEEDADNPGVYVELPLCFDYCVNAHMSCSGDAILSQAACDKAVVVGRVAPPRPDITCVSRAARARGGGGFLEGERAPGIAAGALLLAATNALLLAAPGRGGA